MKVQRLCKWGAAIMLSVGVCGAAGAVEVYASYNGSQRGVTQRDVNTLNQYGYFDTGISASGITVADNDDIYLASGNHLRRYDSRGALLVDMTFPDRAINYGDVAISGNTIVAAYDGSQLGFTIRDAETLEQHAYCQTGVQASGIAVDAYGAVYLAAGNHLLKYSTGCVLLADMSFPDPSIQYTGVAVRGDTLYASYTGSQLGFTTRDTRTLAQRAYCTTGVKAEGIAVDGGDGIYLAAGNHLYKYSASCRQLVNMTFPIPSINYTSVYVK
ncbi:MAG: hypothetical protein PHH47_07180 [Gallionella sp.]|nr:hypothetical protein [Gallionella sp.]MDD4947882.1 hypothetical protein [Gallionella sp.]